MEVFGFPNFCKQEAATDTHFLLWEKKKNDNSAEPRGQNHGKSFAHRNWTEPWLRNFHQVPGWISDLLWVRECVSSLPFWNRNSCSNSTCLSQQGMSALCVWVGVMGWGTDHLTLVHRTAGWEDLDSRSFPFGITNKETYLHVDLLDNKIQASHWRWNEVRLCGPREGSRIFMHVRQTGIIGREGRQPLKQFSCPGMQTLL